MARPPLTIAVPNEDVSLQPGAEAQNSSVLWIAGSLGIVATVAVAILPALVAVWRDSFALRLDQSGYLAAIEIYAQVAGAGVYIATRKYATWRSAAMIGLLVMASGNAASGLGDSFAALLAARCLAGIGAGLLRSQCMTALAGARNPGLVFAIYASVQVTVAALVTIGLPPLIALVGPRMPFMIFAGISCLALYFCRWLPTMIGLRTQKKRRTSHGRPRR